MPRVRREIPEVHALRLRAAAAQRAVSQVSVAGAAPPAVALPDARNRSPDGLSAHAAHCSRGLYHASPQAPLQVASGAVCHGRSRKPAGRPAFRRAADPAGRRFGGRGDLQPHHGARRRRPAGDARTAPGPQTRRLGHRPLPGGQGLPTRTTRSPIPTSARASSDSTTTGASTAPTMPTACARRVSRSRTSTTPRPSPRPSAGYTPCRPITCMWFTKSDRRPSKRLSDGNRPTAIRGLVLPWKSLPQVMEAPLERASEGK